MYEPDWWERSEPALMALKDALTFSRAAAWTRCARAVGRRTAARDCRDDTAPQRTEGVGPTFSCFSASKDRSTAPDPAGCPPSRSASAAVPEWASSCAEGSREGDERKKR